VVELEFDLDNMLYISWSVVQFIGGFGKGGAKTIGFDVELVFDFECFMDDGFWFDVVDLECVFRVF